jgi:nicotinamidase-related amidase
MASVKLAPDSSLLMVVDVQEALVPALFESQRLLDRCRFLVRIAQLLEIPVIVTEQNPSRLGPTAAGLTGEGDIPIPKMCFSACGSPEVLSRMDALGKDQVIVIGTETHICVCQTALDLLDKGFEVVVCPDAVSARSQDRHKLGMERLRDAGVVPAHSEAVAYEWFGSADHPRFREALKIVKAHG